VDSDSPFYFEEEEHKDETISIESDEPYLYRNTIVTKYQDTYDEAMTALENGLVGAVGTGGISTIATSAKVLLASGSYGVAASALVLEEGTSQVVNVAGGKSEFNMYHSAIYLNTTKGGTWTISDGDPSGGTMTVEVEIAGIGPSVVRVNDPLSDGQED